MFEIFFKFCFCFFNTNYSFRFSYSVITSSFILAHEIIINRFTSIFWHILKPVSHLTLALAPSTVRLSHGHRIGPWRGHGVYSGSSLSLSYRIYLISLYYTVVIASNKRSSGIIWRWLYEILVRRRSAMPRIDNVKKKQIKKNLRTLISRQFFEKRRILLIFRRRPICRLHPQTSKKWRKVILIDNFLSIFLYIKNHNESSNS